MFDAVCILNHNLVLKSEIRVEMTIANECMGGQNHLFQFLMKKFKPIKIAFIFSICIHILPQSKKIVYILQIYIIFEMVSILKG